MARAQHGVGSAASCCATNTRWRFRPMHHPACKSNWAYTVAATASAWSRAAATTGCSSSHRPLTNEALVFADTAVRVRRGTIAVAGLFLGGARRTSLGIFLV